MFERRLKLILALPILCASVMVFRLFQLQVIHGEDYEQKVDAALVSPRQYLPFLRGGIQDRYGQPLVSDEPAMDVTVHYGALSMNDSYLMLLADHIRKKEAVWRQATDAEAAAEAGRRIAGMWKTLSEVSGRSLRELREQRDSVFASVEGLRRFVWSARVSKGFDESIEKVRLKEDTYFHPIVRDVSPEARTRIELELSAWEFVRIEPSVRRVWHEGSQSVCHILGQLGPISAERIAQDERRDDPLACYRADDEVGVSGLERVAERMLRGQRGFEDRFLDKRPPQRQVAKDGMDVQLTIDLELQMHIERILSDAVAQHPPSTGASAVVLDVDTREILAAVSLPTYDRATLKNNYRALRDDSIHQPLRFRAVQDRYQPGSIMKPVALLAAYSNDLVDANFRVNCTGVLFPGATKWHCWTHWRGLPGHGELNAEEALQHSCNVFFYTLGQRVGAQRLTDFYRQFVLGGADRPESDRGTQLVEESRGLLPTREWLQEHRHRAFGEADGRNYAIGQGEIQITPLQAANMFATLAAGIYRDPTMITNDGRPRSPIAFPRISSDAWRLMRRGLDRCVNEEGGTAFKYSHMAGLEVCGKTGSAECVPRIAERRYMFETPNGMTRTIEAPTIEAARERLDLPADAHCVSREITRRWPLPDPARVEQVGTDAPVTSKIPTHAWFAGFAPYSHPKIALAVVIEYGGGGGSAAGPVAKQIFETLLESPHGYLTDSGFASVGMPSGD